MLSAPLRLPDPVPVAAPPVPAPAPAPAPARRLLGDILLSMGAIAPADLAAALSARAREGARLGEVLQARGLLSETDLLAALALQFRTGRLDPLADPPDPRLIDAFGVARCLAASVLPMHRRGGVTVVATSRPDAFATHLPALQAAFGPVVMAIAARADIDAALLRQRRSHLCAAAQSRVDAADSARGWNRGRVTAAAAVLAGAALACLILAPSFLVALLMAVAILTLAASNALRLAALCARLPELRTARRGEEFSTSRHAAALARLPCVSVMVPLYQESDIAARLVARLGRITYPRELLDVILVVEALDTRTRDALSAVDLPPWMRVVCVPDAPLKTKPRALNFALDFCRGSIVGVWDAEDAPAPDQIWRVVRRFADRDASLACLQGVLDFYNPRHNWLARCFTIEYATWFRVVLPGMARLGLAVPLGGTTLFFRRAALEDLGGWDAHNVTEDADLGIRLARRGYRTELIDTVTEEEANCRMRPWVRQRSRWLKGYAVTYAVHMRNPRRLLADLGWRRFAGMQVLFVGTLTQTLLAPLLWSFWLIPLGLPHPVAAMAPPALLTAIGVLFVLSELAGMTAAFWAVSGPRHRFLVPWILTLQLYYPLGALAAWKGITQLMTRPFYWDKTAHGAFHAQAPADGASPAAPATASPAAAAALCAA